MFKKSYLTEKAHAFLALLIFFQPVLDIISYWVEQWGMSSYITLGLRIGVLFITVLYAFIITDNKVLYWAAFMVIAVLYVGHLFAIWQAGIVSIMTDFANFVRVVQMPVIAVCVITFLRYNNKAYDGLRFGMTVALWVMLAVLIISVVTGTDPGMYKNGTNFYNTGVRGWFNNTNSQSSNLCVLLPIAIIWNLTAKKRNIFLLYTTIFLGLTALYFTCTRLAYLGIVAVTVGIGVMVLIVKRTDWKHALIVLASGVLLIALIPVSPMTAHLNIYSDAQSVRQDDLVDKIDDIEKVSDLLEKKDPVSSTNSHTEENDNAESGDSTDDTTADPEENQGITEDEYKQLVEQLRPVYEFYISDFVQIFGLEETMEMYDYTTDVKALSALRQKKVNFANAILDASPASARVFGLEYSRFIVSEGKDGSPLLDSTYSKEITEIYDVENDFHGIYFLYGWAGLAAYVLFIGYFVFLVVRALLKNIKKYFTIDATAFGIAFILCMVHAYCTAGVLRRPNASVYLSLVLAGIYYLVKIKKYDEELTERK